MTTWIPYILESLINTSHVIVQYSLMHYMKSSQTIGCKPSGQRKFNLRRPTECRSNCKTLL